MIRASGLCVNAYFQILFQVYFEIFSIKTFKASVPIKSNPCRIMLTGLYFSPYRTISVAEYQ